DDVVLLSLQMQLRPGQVRRITPQPELEIPVGETVDLLLAIRIGGGAPNGATYSASFLPGETRAVGVRSLAQNRLDQPAGPVESEEIRTTVLEGQNVFGLSENPVRSSRVIFSYTIGTVPARAAVYTVT